MIRWKRGDNLLWYRNMRERWKSFDVNVISDIDMPIEIDTAKTRFTLVEKNNGGIKNAILH